MMGHAVIAARPFAAGETILEFFGERLTAAELTGDHDFAEHCLQIGADLFLGPSGLVDDYVNHSCEPNCGLRFGERFFLFALRDIAVGEEITYDYSTSCTEEDWEMRCLCGAAACRGRIADWRSIPPERMRRYLELGAIPRFIVELLPPET